MPTGTRGLALDGRIGEGEWDKAAHVRIRTGGVEPTATMPASVPASAAASAAIASAASVPASAPAPHQPPRVEAELWLAYDTSRLLIAGRVDDPMPPARSLDPFGESSGVALILAPSLGGASPPPTRGDDTGRERAVLWLGRTQEGFQYQELEASAGSAEPRRPALPWSGIRSRHRDLVNGRYEFELSVPFCNIPGLRYPDSAASFELGFDVVAWSGAPGDAGSRQCASLCRPEARGASGSRPALLAPGRLVFSGPHPFGEAIPYRTPLVDRLSASLPAVMLPMSILLLAAIGLLGWSVLLRRVPRSRPYAHVLGVACMALAVVLPPLLGWIRDRTYVSRSKEVASFVREAIPRIGEGSLASMGGAALDGALLDLLAGKAVSPRQGYTLRTVEELTGNEFGSVTKRYPNVNCSVLPYWIQLPPGRTERFVFDEPLRGHQLYAVFARPLPTAQRRGGEEVAPRVRVTLREPGDAVAQTVTELPLDGPFDSAAVFNRENREMALKSLPLKTVVGEISVGVIEGEGVELVGLTVSAEPGDVGRPLALGLASESGIQTDLRGREPDEAGIELYPGQRRTVPIPAARQKHFDRAWICYAAADRGLQAGTALGAKVAEVVFRFRGGMAPLVVPFAHQATMFHELVRLNVEEVPDPKSGVEIAFRWSDARGEARATYSRAVDLPDGAVVEAIELADLGGYPLTFRSVVLGAERLVPYQEGPESPLQVGRGRREVSLKPACLERVKDAWFSIYRGGRQVGSTLPPQLAQQYAAEPRGTRAAGGVESEAEIGELEGGRIYARQVELSGPALSGASLGIFVPDPDRDASHRTLLVLRVVLSLLATPALLSWLAGLVSAIASLRLRLLTVLGVATLAPLIALTVVLVRTLEAENERSSVDVARRAALDAVERLAQAQEQVRRNAVRQLEMIARNLGDLKASRPEDIEKLRRPIAAILDAGMPAEWRFARLVLELGPGPSAPSIVVVRKPENEPGLAGPPQRQAGVSFVLDRGRPLLRFRVECEALGVGRIALCGERLLEPEALHALDPTRTLMVCDARGYAVSSVGPRDLDRAVTEARLQSTDAQQERSVAIAESVARGRPVLARHRGSLAGYAAVLAPLDEGPEPTKLALGLLEPATPAVLDTPFGRLPVRGFFVAVAGLVLIVGVFLALVVTRRITRPIEALERGTLAMRQGDLEVELGGEAKGEIKSLQDSFQQMARELRARSQDLGQLCAGLAEIAHSGDAGGVVAKLIGFCARNSAAERIRVLLFDADLGVACLDGEKDACAPPGAPELAALLLVCGPCCLLPRRDGATTKLGEVILSAAGVIAVPMLAGTRLHGVVLLLLESRAKAELNLEAVVTVATHAALALESLRLEACATEDRATLALRREHFARLLGAEVSKAQAAGSSCALLALAVPAAIADRLGPEALDRCLALAASAVRRTARGPVGLGRTAPSELQIVLPGRDRAAAELFARSLLDALAEQAWPRDLQVAGAAFSPRVAAYPKDAGSAEYLREALSAAGSPDAPGSAAAGEPGWPEHRAAELAALGLVATSPRMRALIATVEKVAPADLSILIQGETGTGKEVLANLIHAWSRRSSGPLIRVHCAAIPANLLQSELFGYEKGAFTGAVARKAGKFEQANGGTIFLDEIGEISPEVQVSLLRVLQERVVDRIGGTAPVPVDVRLLTATNRNLQELVRAGTFREDLYYRLQGMVLDVPALRERRVEIAPLAKHILAEAIAGEQTKAKGFSAEALDELFRRDWPGNVRELRNVVLRAAVLATSEWITPRDLAATQPSGPEVAIPGPVLEPAAPQGPRNVPAEASAPTAASDAGSRGDSESVSGAAPLEPDPRSEVADSVPEPSSDPTQAMGEAEDSERVETGTQPPPPRIDDIIPAGQSSSPPPPLEIPRPAPERPLPSSLPSRLQDLLSLIERRGTLAAQDYVASNQVSARTGLRDLTQLLELGLIQRVGKRRGARYQLVMQPPAPLDGHGEKEPAAT